MSPSLLAIKFWASLPCSRVTITITKPPGASWLPGWHDCWATEWLGIPAFTGIHVPRTFLEY